MHIKQLLEEWSSRAHAGRPVLQLTIKLPLEDAARLLALEEMFPGRDREQLVTELLHVALDDVQAALPYVQGKRVIASDEFGDPMYEDIGPTPRFLQITDKYRKQLQAQQRATN